MKKAIVFVLCLLLTGCSGISKEDYEKIVQENQQLQEQVEELQSQISNTEKLPDVRITGGIVATLHDILPNPFVGDGVPRYALIQYFQSGLTLVKVDPEIANELEIGESYYFEIEPYTVRNDRYQFTKEQVMQLAHNGPWLTITDYREPQEDEWGITTKSLMFFEELN